MEANDALQEVIVAPSLSKATQSIIAENLAARVINGFVDPMQAFIQVKAISEICSQFLKTRKSSTAQWVLSQDAAMTSPSSMAQR